MANVVPELAMIMDPARHSVLSAQLREVCVPMQLDGGRRSMLLQMLWLQLTYF